jgi:hypothetical protein
MYLEPWGSRWPHSDWVDAWAVLRVTPSVIRARFARNMCCMVRGLVSEVIRHERRISQDSGRNDDWAPDAYTWLQGWYASHANGDWEHEYGVEIGTLDNPRWRVEIDLAGTELAGHEFNRLKSRRSAHDWLEAWVEGDTYQERAAH